jgi:hypothetical protein
VSQPPAHGLPLLRPRPRIQSRQNLISTCSSARVISERQPQLCEVQSWSHARSREPSPAQREQSLLPPRHVRPSPSTDPPKTPPRNNPAAATRFLAPRGRVARSAHSSSRREGVRCSRVAARYPLAGAALRAIEYVVARWWMRRPRVARVHRHSRAADGRALSARTRGRTISLAYRPRHTRSDHPRQNLYKEEAHPVAQPCR